MGTRLFLKAERCSSPKCAMIRRPYRPGQHGQSRHVLSEFAKELREKQKLQITYGLNNRQMQKLFSNTREKVIVDLETRLDRIVFLSGLAASPRVARQMVGHGHIWVNQKKVTIPSYHVKEGEVINIRPESRSLKIFEGLIERLKKISPPGWLAINQDDASVKCVKRPGSEDLNLLFDLNLVGQYYSH